MGLYELSYQQFDEIEKIIFGKKKEKITSPLNVDYIDKIQKSYRYMERNRAARLEIAFHSVYEAYKSSKRDASLLRCYNLTPLQYFPTDSDSTSTVTQILVLLLLIVTHTLPLR